jgi:hypothetical protein
MVGMSTADNRIFTATDKLKAIRREIGWRLLVNE